MRKEIPTPLHGQGQRDRKNDSADHQSGGNKREDSLPAEGDGQPV